MSTAKTSPRTPDALLEELRTIIARMNAGEEDRDDPDTLVSRFEELDAQLAAGGALPAAWAVRK
jgi:hypothetical protein